MASITGLGGVFLRTKNDTKKLLAWYSDVLGLDVSEYGINFLTPNHFTLITFTNKDDDAVLNFSVDDLEVFMQELKAKDVKIHSDIKEYDFGKFAQIKDPFDNIVELAELYDQPYKEMVEEEIKTYKRQS